VPSGRAGKRPNFRQLFRAIQRPNAAFAQDSPARSPKS
jgi:hypothetical protein